MAIAVNFDDITQRIKDKISGYVVTSNANLYQANRLKLPLFKVLPKQNKIMIPIGMWSEIYKTFPERKFKPQKVVCHKTLYTLQTDPKKTRDQNVVFAEVHKTLMEHHSAFIAAFPGFGKTTLGNAFIATFGLKTLIVCHSDEVLNQWEAELEQFSTARVQRLKGAGCKLDPSCNVYICGVIKASNMTMSDFTSIGFVIFDEAHICTATAFSKVLLKIRPNYILALSATPERKDGMHRIFEYFFGVKEKFIVRHEVKKFTVYKYQTDFVPEIKKVMRQGKMVKDWTKLINSLYYNPKRHKLIVDIILKHPNDHILVLSNRKIQSQGIYDLLQAKKVKDVELLIGNKKLKNKDYRILIAEAKKASVGFDDPRLKVLILASDLPNVEQSEGRIRMHNNIVYDVVDCDESLERHWASREKWYKKRGATIKVIGSKRIIAVRSENTFKLNKRYV